MDLKRKKRNSLLSKKGNAILDTLVFIILVVIFIVISIFSYSIYNEMSTDLRADLNTNNTNINETLNVVENRFPSVFDGLVIFLFLGLWIVTLLASFMSDTHPIFFIISVILLVIVIVAVMLLSNFFTELLEDESLDSVGNSFPASMWIVENLVIVSIVIGASILIVLYGKNRYG